ncbi:TPA: hypothetical protein ACW5GJ_004454 [Salmonella enterica]
MALKKNIKLDKKDYTRALLCDTQPADCPIIFSNDGLYANLAYFDVNYKTSTDFTPLSSFLKKIINPRWTCLLRLMKESRKGKNRASLSVTVLLKILLA